MELNDLINLIEANRAELNSLGCSDTAIDHYLDTVEDGYEPDAYKDITVMELAEDIVLAEQSRG